MCAQSGTEPDPDEMPPSLEDYPYEVQVAFFIHDILSDRWDGNTGHYMGKDISSLHYLLDIWEVEDKKTCVYFIKHIEARHTRKLNLEGEKQRKAAERKAKRPHSGGGINVQG
jgi:hypothetical protein